MPLPRRTALLLVVTAAAAQSPPPEFDCLRWAGPLQTVEPSGEPNATWEVAMLDAGTGLYETVMAFPEEVTRLNGAAMLTTENGSFAMASIVFGPGDSPSLCLFDHWGVLQCLVGDLVGPQASCGAIVDTTYYYGSGIGKGGAFYTVQNVDTASPNISDVPFRIPPIPGFVVLDVAPCEYGCVISDAVADRGFLIGLSAKLTHVFVASLDDDLLPDKYLVIKGLDVTDANGTSAGPLQGFFDSCFSFTSDGSQLRLACASSGGDGLYELELPLNVTACDKYWSPFSNDTATFLPLVCDVGDAPPVRFLLHNEQLPTTDGFGCDVYPDFPPPVPPATA